MRPFNLILLLLLGLAALVAATYTPIPITKEIGVYALGKAAKLVTPKDKAIFWSQAPPAGYADMNEYLTKQYKPTSGGKLLLIDLITADGGPPTAWVDNYGYWAAMSRYFAAGASGDIVYIAGSPRPGFNYKQSVFFQTELPELTKPGTKVTSIVAIDAATLKIEKLIWEPGYGHWGMGGADEAKTPADIFEVPTAAACGGKVKRANGAACPMRGASSKAKKVGGGAAPKGGAAAAGGGARGTVTTKTAGAGKKQPKAAVKQARPASGKLRSKRAGPSRMISWDF